MGKKKKNWQERLSKEPDERTVNFVESISYDKRLYKYDIVGSIAHAKMLAERKLISGAEFKQIRDGLLQIAEKIDSGKFKFDKAYEDIHMAIEAALIKKIGKAGQKLHTGRSRNDQVATDIRLWVRDEIVILQDKITRLQKALVGLAGKYVEDIMPGYTHLQRAQPVSIGIYVLSFTEALERDFIRLGNCRRLVNICPLGSGAVAGSTLPLDRKSTAEQLGFTDISYNSIDAVGDRDFCAEFVFDCALIATHLSKLAEDWIIYNSSEFSFVVIDDSFCTSSSMMPQKRNPDVLELIRAKAAGVNGSLVSILTLLKALPSGYNRDLQEDKVHIFSAADSVEAMLDVAEGVVSNSTFKTDKIAAGLDEGFADATALAEYLVTKGIAFREAHQIVGKLVAQCEKQGEKLSELSLESMKKSCDAIGEDVYQSLGCQNVVKNYATEGSAGIKQAKEQIAYWQKYLVRR